MKNLHTLTSAILFIILFSSLQAQTDPGYDHLRHLWMFEEDANDLVGGAHGTIEGGVIENGNYILSEEADHIQLPAETINMKDYSEVSVAIWFRALPDSNTGFHSIWYFGDTINNGSEYALGSDYYYLSPARGDEVCRSTISCLADVPEEPWSYEEYADRDPDIDDNDSLFFIVSTLNDTMISMFIGAEGKAELESRETELLREESKIANIGNSLAYIGRNGYEADPSFRSTIYEMRIYDKALDADEVDYLYQQGHLDSPPEELISNDATLSDLKSGGITVPEFYRTQYDYAITLPSGTTEIPEVTATANYDSTNIVITATSTIPGTTTIEVTAENDTAKNTYTISYTMEGPLSIPAINTNLKHLWTFENNANDVIGDANGNAHGGMYENGAYVISAEEDYIELPGHTISMNEYPEVSVAGWFRAAPEVDNEFAALWYFGSSIEIDGTLWGSDYFLFRPTLFNEACHLAISCNADDPDFPWAYEDYLRREPGMQDNDSLFFVVGTLKGQTITLYVSAEGQDNIEIIESDIQREENTVANISNDLAYIGKSGYEADPPFQGSIYEVGIYDKALNLDEVSTLFEHGSMVSEETLPSDDATLSDLQRDGITVPDFHADTLEYTIGLSNGTTDVPEITAIANHENATVDIKPAVEIPGTTTIAVGSEDGAYLNMYSIHFTELPYVLSDDATLSDLQSDGTTVAGFDADNLEYNIEVADSTTEVPEVIATANHDSATIMINLASEIPGTTTIVVTAQDYTFKRTYTIHYFIPPYIPSSDATLSDLKSDGVTVPEFDPEKFDYSIVLPSGTLNIPEVTATANHDSAEINILPANDVPGSTNVIVIAEDDTSNNQYVINYTIATGLYETSPDGISIHPNPVNNTLHIENADQAHVLIYTPEGKLVKQTRLKDEHAAIDVSALENGLYLIEIRENDRRKMGRFIKK